MIHITKLDLEHLEKIGSGTFGTVFKYNDDTAFKIYHDKIKSDFGLANNPALHHQRSRLNRLMERGRNLKYSEVVRDLIILDGKFQGVVVPYYEGNTASGIMRDNFSRKLSVSKQLVRNAKELTSHFIYPDDYKLNNMIIHNGELKLIDLDDPLTYVPLVPSIFKKRKSIQVLNETIRTIFNEYKTKPYSYQLNHELGIQYNIYADKYEEIEQYLSDKEKEISFILVDKNSDKKRLKSILNIHPFLVLYCCSDKVYKDEYYHKIIEEFHMMGIPIYDFVFLGSELESYFKDFNTKEKYVLEKKNMLRR